MAAPNNFYTSKASKGDLVAFLDGAPVAIPSERNTLNSIRCFLETLALSKQHVLFSLKVDGIAIDLSLSTPPMPGFSRVDAESVSLDDGPLLVLKKAWQQAEHVRQRVEASLTLVLINEASVACELWWDMARLMKDPILTMSFLPDHLCGPANGRFRSSNCANGNWSRLPSSFAMSMPPVSRATR